jgi:hypothetical protein
MSCLKMATVQEKIMCVFWFFETSLIKMQHRHITHNANQYWLQQFQETGSILHRKGVGRPGSS